LLISLSLSSELVEGFLRVGLLAVAAPTTHTPTLTQQHATSGLPRMLRGSDKNMPALRNVVAPSMSQVSVVQHLT
jgi:hypothetical protein